MKIAKLQEENLLRRRLWRAKDTQKRLTNSYINVLEWPTLNYFKRMDIMRCTAGTMIDFYLPLGDKVVSLELCSHFSGFQRCFFYPGYIYIFRTELQYTTLLCHSVNTKTTAVFLDM